VGNELFNNKAIDTNNVRLYSKAHQLVLSRGERQGQVIKILIDTREQRPLEFKSKYITQVIRRKLDIGDYGCEFEDGHVVPIFFERKSIGDLYGTMGKGYKRFRQCINKSHKEKTTLFIITEGTLNKVLGGYNRSQIKGSSMLYKLFTLWVKHGIQTIFCSSREEMSEYITQFYVACGKQHIRKKGKN